MTHAWHTKIVYILLMGVITSCSSISYPKFDYNYSSNPWIGNFKDQVFFSALRAAYKNDTTLFNLIEKRDAFNPYDGLSLDALNMARSLGTSLIKNMPPPAMCEECEDGMNYYMATALHYYNSKELDLIARAEYKKYVKTR
jgi:hypothetical protein